MPNGLKIRWNIFRAGSSPAARTNCLCVRLMPEEGQKWATSKPSGKVVVASDQQYITPRLRGHTRFITL